MGIRRKGKSVEVKLLIPEMVYLEFEKALTNNFSSKPVYGMRSQIITSLIQKWLEETRELEQRLKSTKEINYETG